MEIEIIPRWIIKQLASNYGIQHELNILLSNVLFILLFLIFKDKVLELMNLVPHFCLFDKIFGIECPVCGTTRAFCEISKGNYLNAYNLNFSSFFVASYFLSQIPLRLITLSNNDFILRINTISKIFGLSVIVVLIINWFINLVIQ
jgi:hypothetical protein